MLLIQTDSVDITTNKVIDWLKYYAVNFVRINNLFSDVNNLLFDGENFNFEIGINKLSSKNISSFWYRRCDERQIKDIEKTKIENTTVVSQNIKNEWKAIETLFYKRIIDSKKPILILNNPFLINLNKTIIFNYAKKCKLLTPEFIITTSKEELISFNNTFTTVIKPCSDVQLLKTNNALFYQYTTLITKKNIKKIPNIFFPTMFQQYINKDFEIRSFYIDGKIYSMAIFSQENHQTKVDFRRYDYKNPNIVSPFNLPKSIEKKLSNLFKILKINCGSIDLIHTPDDKYYFLEINPIGQFGVVSSSCNYYLERLIALKFKTHENKTTKKNY